ncbi:MAG: hypothetical protein GKR97_12710 [Rhizobiaceae bacterium]|nr:hypothetical protein [Rhizobiaceae bacterium]
MIATVSVGIVLSVLIAFLISSFDGSQYLSSLSWLTFTAFPLFVVVVIASLARLQERIDVRAPSSHDAESVNRGNSSS